jgi:hypothetical protein
MSWNPNREEAGLRTDDTAAINALRVIRLCQCGAATMTNIKLKRFEVDVPVFRKSFDGCAAGHRRTCAGKRHGAVRAECGLMSLKPHAAFRIARWHRLPVRANLRG